MQAAAQTPACRIEPPSRCFQRHTSSMKAREPAMTPPIGAPSPFEKSIQAESQPEAMICTVWMLGMVAIAPKVGRPSRHSLRRRLRVGIADVNAGSIE